MRDRWNIVYGGRVNKGLEKLLRFVGKREISFLETWTGRPPHFSHYVATNKQNAFTVFSPRPDTVHIQYPAPEQSF
jgi:hypothetical protein